MFIICYGPHKSGSTLCFQLVSALLEARGHPQDNLPPGVVESGRSQNFGMRAQGRDRDWLYKLAAHARDPRLIAIKSHGACNTTLGKLIDCGQVAAVVNIRDPRDILLALRDAGRKHTSGAFSAIDGAGDALERVQRGVAITAGWLRSSALVADYEEIAFDTPRFLRRLASHLNLAPPDEVLCGELYRRAAART